MFGFCRFCVGDRFYLCDNKILCEYDYEERMIFASMQHTYNTNSSCSNSVCGAPTATAAAAAAASATGYNALHRMKQQTESLSDTSSGYNSPSPGSL